MLRPPSPSFHMHEKELTTSTSSRACTQVQPHLRASWGGADHAQHDGTTFLRFRRTQLHQWNSQDHPLAARGSLRSMSPAGNSAQQILDLPSWKCSTPLYFCSLLARLVSDAQSVKLEAGTVVISLHQRHSSSFCQMDIHSPPTNAPRPSSTPHSCAELAINSCSCF